MAVRDLWGDFGEVEEVTTPTLHLKQQALLLRDKTRGLLEAQVEQRGATRGGFHVTFYIVVPTLNNYMYELLHVVYPIDLYPVTIHECVGDETYECDDEESFLVALEAILTSDEVRRVISVLVSQSKS